MGTLGTKSRALFFINRQTPALSLMQNPGELDAYGSVSDAKNPVAHLAQGGSQPGPLRAIVSRTKRQGRLGSQGKLVQI